ncbi:hypothetical protein Pst134EA_028129 [Puccinia striiformis f. sp. tritici]|uniref:hypothetical protein n=1 Tax=Puccinia striiformis f. sp. tritici TaxID=168172 RepID=UPI0020075D0B|nr:hypothetical protein Pst134EA_028129 [Puccinia striiformis f. sp. tritici]KAH9448834.1 hypothetical protein Pst134EA_028129 [Puccinia striiformis f. sp. tritici]
MSPMLAAQHLTAAWQEPAIAKVSASVPTTKPEPTTNQPSLQITLAGQHPTTVEQKKGVTETPEKFLSHDVTQPQLFPQPIVNAVFMKKPILAAVLAKDFIPPFNSISKNSADFSLAEVPRPNPTSPSLKLSNTVVPQPPASHQPTISEVSTDPMTKPESNNRPALAEVPHLNPTSPLTKSTFDSINPIKADNQSTVEDLSRMANNPKHSQSSSSTCSSRTQVRLNMIDQVKSEILSSRNQHRISSKTNDTLRMLFAAAPTSLPVPPMQKTKFTPDPQPSHLPTSFPSTQAHISFKPLPITKLMLPAPATQEPIIDNCQTSSNNI